MLSHFMERTTLNSNEDDFSLLVGFLCCGSAFTFCR